ncbi:hypothetical protein [Haloterrigena alkaliphila]|uniref:Uncharacterized protein n=1 Tax=Haloterrigena alkaliphila TaxID=2816475 RepID=A0A8A2VFL7_9EURY|nr:hypothetical protein [Haloterrigena alkaliphila]QSX00097.1 hypothetical protein J0X25_03780 [Haloterrigena alkaliphila]
MDNANGESGPNRFLNTRLTARTLLTLAVVLSVALAGCTGMGGLGDGGDETSATGGNGDDGSGADDVGPGSMFGDGADADDAWFDLSQPGYYAFDLAGMDEETGEQVTGRLVYDVEAAGEEMTASVNYEFGDEQYQSTVTGPADEISGQLFLTPAHAPVLALQSVSLLYYFEMGFTDPTVGNRKQTTTDEGTQVTEVTEKRSYAGLECAFVETTVDGELTQQGCLRISAGGIAPYAATYTADGDLELEVELVEYESN